ncbi:MAG TPA: universal stress protein [candidate division Zixibacteria bacterium]|nr:universal stress protein [candidate division Zixibacteria bacterium]
MASRIVVPLRSSDSIEQFLPYLEKLAQPGMKLLFVVRSSRNGIDGLMDQLSVFPSAVRPVVSSGMPRASSIRDQIRSAEGWILPRCEALLKAGVEIEVAVHGGAPSRVVRDFARRPDVHLIVVGRRRGDLRARLERALRLLFRAVEPRRRPPMLVFSASRTAGPAG